MVNIPRPDMHRMMISALRRELHDARKSLDKATLIIKQIEDPDDAGVNHILEGTLVAVAVTDDRYKHENHCRDNAAAGEKT